MVQESKSSIPRSENGNAPKIEIEQGCFVCHGSGHCAREVNKI